MAPSTRQTSGSNNGEELVNKQYVDDAMTEIRQTLAAMNSTITALSIQTTQVVNHGTGRQANQFGRLAKVEFPKFHGDDVRGWVFRCEQFFLIDNTPPEEKVRIVSVHLFDKALLWQRQCIKTMGENVVWDVYKEAIIQRSRSVFEDPMAELKNATYDKSAKEYQDLFDTLLCRADVSEVHALSLYLGGLPTELEMSVRMFKQKKLSDVYCLTTLQEATLEVIKKKNKPLGSHHVGRFGMSSDSGSSNKPPLLPFPYANNISNPNPTTALKTPVRKQLTQKEYEEKRAKNMGFYCDKKFVPGHKCEGKLFSLVVLPMKELEEKFEDAQEELDELENEELPQISLNALNGASSFQTMRVVGRDGKSIRNRQGKPIPEPVGSGSGAGEMTFVTHVLLWPLGGCEMVLGIQWLATLGDIKCNFKALRMEFAHNNKKLVIREPPPPLGGFQSNHQARQQLTTRHSALANKVNQTAGGKPKSTAVTGKSKMNHRPWIKGTSRFMGKEFWTKDAATGTHFQMKEALLWDHQMISHLEVVCLGWIVGQRLSTHATCNVDTPSLAVKEQIATTKTKYTVKASKDWNFESSKGVCVNGVKFEYMNAIIFHTLNARSINTRADGEMYYGQLEVILELSYFSATVKIDRSGRPSPVMMTMLMLMKAAEDDDVTTCVDGMMML
ncbi:hypothetical protein Tco_0150895 [Tanacetum coccineum]